MPYISFLNSWKNHDLKSVTDMIDDAVSAYYINDFGDPIALNKSRLIHLLATRMSAVEADPQLQWNFEMIHRAHIHGNQMIMFYTYTNEDQDYKKTTKTLVTVTFGDNASKNNQIKTVYITPNVTDV
ncbi:hypothetical protein GLV88_11815 [Staphylococcus hyicus]|uniref:hypothetical protein n=1 Tax=Staphylococcus hyicus TaxID=1284 RepID=UPI00057DCDED|nr:hypothetical protein [Staphylococcus hyicus]AJC95630.1 hypothetical protein SHYC_04205 [Staphylococcus hyicus]MCO4330093.1 hypothetical protein [Staphylococcus hyicus]MCO4332511.1 hypothetical protein [Staphylococcus hyicus]MCO4333606.1 hypothetical protein [Staphylococcus hyicus]MCO4336557.1 hypothetical protein [Staphylococcus hyicus]